MIQVAYIFDPEAAGAARVDGLNFDDRVDRIKVTYEIKYEGEDAEVVIVSPVAEFNSFIVACLNALGFSEGDLEYVAQRLIKEVSE